MQRRGARWWLIAPDGRPFWSIGLNHVDSATLRYAESGDVWRRAYGNSMEAWLSERVRADLLDWGFNTVGWVQDGVTGVDGIIRHSRNFALEEYRWLGLPYCHLLPIAETHWWECETRNPDLTGAWFEEWCDYVARDQCARFADDPNCVGYFYVDCPTWVHTVEANRWKGPLFDPKRLETPEGRRELHDLADRYYRVVHEAIRRYDPNHLIFGDRYEARAALPEEVLQAAAPYVDVLSFQHFGPAEQIAADLRRFAEGTGKPVLLADSAQLVRAEPHRSGWTRHVPGGYAATLAALRGVPSCVGFHFCGAYLRNRARRWGLRDLADTPIAETVEEVRRENERMHRWVAGQAADARPGGQGAGG